jgi:hypothetical protein
LYGSQVCLVATEALWPESQNAPYYTEQGPQYAQPTRVVSNFEPSTYDGTNVPAYGLYTAQVGGPPSQQSMHPSFLPVDQGVPASPYSQRSAASPGYQKPDDEEDGWHTPPTYLPGETEGPPGSISNTVASSTGGSKRASPRFADGTLTNTPSQDSGPCN